MYSYMCRVDFLHSLRFQHLFPPLHDLCAHLNQPLFRLAVRKARNGLDCFIDVFLRQCARLLEAGAAGDDFSRLD